VTPAKLRAFPGDARALLSILALGLLLIVLALFDIYGDIIMKRLGLGALLVAAAIALAGCVTPTGLEKPRASAAGVDSLAVLREANRHIETCHRTYMWPFAFTIDCPPATPAPQALSAEQIRGMVADAVKAALKPADPAAQ
jgi:hypothetical protein